jgi:hypothetical protein
MSLRARFLPTLLCSALLFPLSSVHADDTNPADYPLRLHIFNREEATHYHRGTEEMSQGTGRANLFVHGEVHAVDFRFDCNHKIESSIGFDTYKARWLRPGQKLTVLFPVFGVSGKFFTCDLDTDVKSGVAYYTHGGNLSTEPSTAFTAWMQKHNYDPEHGKNTPSSPEAAK